MPKFKNLCKSQHHKYVGHCPYCHAKLPTLARRRAPVMDGDAETGCADDQVFGNIPVDALRAAADKILK